MLMLGDVGIIEFTFTDTILEIDFDERSVPNSVGITVFTCLYLLFNKDVQQSMICAAAAYYTSMLHQIPSELEFLEKIKPAIFIIALGLYEVGTLWVMVSFLVGSYRALRNAYGWVFDLPVLKWLSCCSFSEA